MSQVKFKPAGVSIELDPAMSLLDTARRAGLRIRKDCCGQGVWRRFVRPVSNGHVHRLSHRHELEEGSTCRAAHWCWNPTIRALFGANTVDLPEAGH